MLFIRFKNLTTTHRITMGINVKGKLLLSWILIFLYHPVFSIEKRLTPLSLKTSVIIPCHYKHAQYLPFLLQAFSEQTVLPDEIIISLSEYKKVPEDLVESLTSTSYPFLLVLLPFENAVSEGANRNYGCAYAKGDIFICHDADDFPHPQRIEVIKWFFETYQVDHLMHTWGNRIEELSRFQGPEEISWFHLPEYTNKLGSGIYTNGPVAISRQVFDVIQWDPAFRIGVDVEFNKRAYVHFANTIVLEAPLYIYRHTLSSYKEQS